MPPKRRFPPGRWLALACALAAALALALPAAGGSPAQGQAFPTSGKALYQKACLACHGPDGKGQPPARLGFDDPQPPDFTDCNFATREANRDWLKVSQEGGPARAFDRMMPAFGSILSKEQLLAVLNYIRTFCTNPCWPRGELNLPRALFTTKAFPEDELVLQSVYDTSDNKSLTNKLSFEKRIGPRGQLEITAPYNWVEEPQDGGGTQWNNGLGDVAVSYKQVLYASLDTGAIVSLGGEFLLPTGDQNKGLGAGTTRFEPYVSYGQILPAQFFFQFQGGGAIPYDGAKANEELFGRLAVGRSFYTGVIGRRWTPMVELLASRELVSGEDVLWDIVPQFQVVLSTRKHVRLGLGTRIPLNQTDTRDLQFGLYILWDWFDGGLFEGW